MPPTLKRKKDLKGSLTPFPLTGKQVDPKNNSNPSLIHHSVYLLFLNLSCHSKDILNLYKIPFYVLTCTLLSIICLFHAMELLLVTIKSSDIIPFNI